jgi:hypothetical protein
MNGTTKRFAVAALMTVSLVAGSHSTSAAEQSWNGRISDSMCGIACRDVDRRFQSSDRPHHHRQSASDRRGAEIPSERKQNAHFQPSDLAAWLTPPAITLTGESANGTNAKIEKQ